MKQATELEEFLHKASGNEKFKILIQLADIYQNISLDKSLDYYLQALELSHKIKSKIKKSDIYINIGNIYKEKSEYNYWWSEKQKKEYDRLLKVRASKGIFALSDALSSVILNKTGHGYDTPEYKASERKRSLKLAQEYDSPTGQISW